MKLNKKLLREMILKEMMWSFDEDESSEGVNPDGSCCYHPELQRTECPCSLDDGITEELPAEETWSPDEPGFVEGGVDDYEVDEPFPKYEDGFNGVTCRIDEPVDDEDDWNGGPKFSKYEAVKLDKNLLREMIMKELNEAKKKKKTAAEKKKEKDAADKKKKAAAKKKKAKAS